MTSERTKAMDDLIAQDADLIDNPLVAAVRELLTDDSVEHLDVFTHNLVQALDKHGLKVVSADYLDNLNDTVRGLRQDIKAEQKHTDTSRSGDLVERLRDGVLYGDARLHNPKGHDPLRMEAADLIETQAREIKRKDAALRLFLALIDDPDYDLGELCEEFVPIARAALAGESHDQ